jgi:hypothetical protein
MWFICSGPSIALRPLRHRRRARARARSSISTASAVSGRADSLRISAVRTVSAPRIKVQHQATPANTRPARCRGRSGARPTP